MSNIAVIESLMSEFSKLFKEELDVLKEIKPTIKLQLTAQPCFCKN